MLSEEALEAAATGNNGGPFSFYTEIYGQPTITAPDPMTPQAAQDYMTWQELLTDPTMDNLDVNIEAGDHTGRKQGQGAEIIK